MVKQSGFFALALCCSLPAYAHPGSHAAMDSASFTAHVIESPFHLAFLGAAAITAVAFTAKLFSDSIRQRRITSRRS